MILTATPLSPYACIDVCILLDDFVKLHFSYLYASGIVYGIYRKIMLFLFVLLDWMQPPPHIAPHPPRPPWLLARIWCVSAISIQKCPSISLLLCEYYEHVAEIENIMRTRNRNWIICTHTHTWNGISQKVHIYLPNIYILHIYVQVE